MFSDFLHVYVVLWLPENAFENTVYNHSEIVFFDRFTLVFKVTKLKKNKTAKVKAILVILGTHIFFFLVVFTSRKLQI